MTKRKKIKLPLAEPASTPPTKPADPEAFEDGTYEYWASIPIIGHMHVLVRAPKDANGDQIMEALNRDDFDTEQLRNPENIEFEFVYRQCSGNVCLRTSYDELQYERN